MGHTARPENVNRVLNALEEIMEKKSREGEIDGRRIYR
jgi:hypothetical protein